jgi:hypothetical protein
MGPRDEDFAFVNHEFRVDKFMDRCGFVLMVARRNARWLSLMHGSRDLPSRFQQRTVGCSLCGMPPTSKTTDGIRIYSVLFSKTREQQNTGTRAMSQKKSNPFLAVAAGCIAGASRTVVFRYYSRRQEEDRDFDALENTVNTVFWFLTAARAAACALLLHYC